MIIDATVTLKIEAVNGVMTIDRMEDLLSDIEDLVENYGYLLNGGIKVYNSDTHDFIQIST